MRKLIIVIGATLIGASVLATSVLANTPGPTATAVPQTATSGDHASKALDRLNDVLTGLVQKGVITTQQKDAILDAVKNAAGHRDFDARHFVGDVVKGSSDYLGIPVGELKTQLAKGKSLGEIANATAGKSRDGLRAVDVAGVNDQVDASENLEQAIGKPIQEFRAVGVGNHSNASRHAAARATGRRVSRTMRGARLRTAAMPNTAVCPMPKASAPRGGPKTPPR